MNRCLSATWAFTLIACLSIVDVAAARADTTVTLQGITFADGATASGYFLLNIYGYVDGAAITTTPGTSMGGVSLPGYTYTSGGVANAPAPFDTLFFFNSTADAFSLALEVADPLGPGYSGFDPLVPGSGSGASLAGSIETCQQNPQACGGASYLDGRLVTAGTLYAPEPAALTLLGVGAGLLPIVRRKSPRAKGGVA